MSSPDLVRRALAAAVLPLILSSLGACGSDQTTRTGADTTESATPTDPSTEAGDDGESLDTASFVDELRSAVEESSTAHTTMTMDAGGQQISAEGDVSYGSERPAMKMKVKIPAMGHAAIEMRMVDGVTYMAMPPMTPAGKFLKLDPQDPTSPFAGMGDLTRQMDPRASFDAFEAGLKKVRHIGKESVAGEELDHYALTLDAAAVAKTQGLPKSAGMPSAVEYDVWLDGESRMRKVTIDLGPQGDIEMTMSEWGKPVDVQAPARSQIVEIPMFRR